MTTRAILSLAAAAALAALPIRPATAQQERQPPSPREILGFEVGADRRLADWGEITGYFTRLASASPAVRLDTLGRTTNGLPLVVATISSPDNIRRVDAIRQEQRRLADPRLLGEADERRLVATQPAVIYIQGNIHGNEIAASQMAMELAWRLATNDTLQRALQNVVVLLVPSANPDGQQIITDWYRRTLGTEWEGGPVPWLYHPYVGHDNNRDWYMVTQKETRLVTDLLYRQWFPQVVYDVHQMGNEGARLFVPPFVDPVNPNVDPLIVRGIGHIGAAMAWALEAQGKQGVADGVIYDLWWHGGARSTPTRHNMIGILTEAASVRIATPITQTAEDLRGHARGLPRYERRMNFPNPWPGGVWRLRDIVEYELIAAEALVKLASDEREEFVRNFVQLGRKQIRRGAEESPRAFVIPRSQPDQLAVDRLVEVLRLGGVEVEAPTGSVTADGRAVGPAYVVRLAQPYRAHAKDLLEAQQFPRMEQWPGGPVERPYDVAGWTLPLQMGVQVLPADSIAVSGGPPSCVRSGEWAVQNALLLDPRDTRSYQAVFGALSRNAAVRRSTTSVTGPCGEPWPHGAFVVARGSGSQPGIQGERVRAPRVGLYKPWTANMDEGWTRWLLEQFGAPFRTVTDSMVRAGRLRDQFDVLIVPDMSLREAREGMSPTRVPPPYSGGLGAAGIAAIGRFVQTGGTLVTFDQAAEVAMAALPMQVRRIAVPPRRTDRDDERSSDGSGRARDPLYAPGSILRVLVDTQHPVAFGMPDTAAVYFTNSVSFDVPADGRARVIARYPEREGDILLSGFLQGGAAIAGKAAAVEVPVGQGRVVMFGFRPQYRGQSYGTFRMLFNAILSGGQPTARR